MRNKQPKLGSSTRVWRKSKKLEKMARENREANLTLELKVEEALELKVEEALELKVGEERWGIRTSQVR